MKVKQPGQLRYLTVPMPLRTLLSLEKASIQLNCGPDVLARIMIEGAIPALVHELEFGPAEIVVQEPEEPGDPQEVAISFRHLRG